MNTTHAEQQGSSAGIWLLVTSILLAALGALGALLLWLPPDSGFMPGLGTALALLLLGTVNLLCLPLNLAYLWLSRHYRAGRGRRCLWGIVALQTIPAVYFAGLLANWGIERYQDEQARQQTAAIRQAITRDDLESYVHAHAQCGQLCRKFFPREAHLLNAARQRAYGVAEQLVAQGVKVSAGLTAPTRDLRTCENDYLPSVHTLEMAVANNDARMLSLLLPVSDQTARQYALWMAARLDRLELLQEMEKAGVPLTIRGRSHNEHASLLVAAGSGAAVRTGRWLIEKHHMPIQAEYDEAGRRLGESPFSALMYFAYGTDSPRTRVFLQLLLEHGADIEERRLDGTTWLQEAIRTRNREMALLLLDAGATRQGLTFEQAGRLDALLAAKPHGHWGSAPTDCVPVS